MQSIDYVETSIHLTVERLLRHRLALLIVLALMVVAMVRFDSRFQKVMQQAYDQGFGWIGTYMRHEHPTHAKLDMAINRVPTISSGS